MAVSDLPLVTEEIPEAPEAHLRRGVYGFLTRRPVLFGLALLIAGVAMIVFGLYLPASDGLVKYPMIAVGVVATYVGLKLLALASFGPEFDLALWLSGAWIAVVFLAAVLADLLPLGESHDISQTLDQPIRTRPDLISGHPFGTDDSALDILGGVVYGARVSLTVGIGAVLIGMTIGAALGLAAGYYRGKLDTVVSVLTDSTLAFPPLILLLAMVTVLEPNVRNVTVALAVIGIPTYVRLARANTFVYSQREFVLAARALGDRNRNIIFRELLPNVLLPIVSFSFLIIAVLIVAEASLSFLGLSVPRPTPTWGNMISAGQNRFDENPHIVFIPGAVLFLTVFSFNRLGDRARELWDPREAKI